MTTGPDTASKVVSIGTSDFPDPRAADTRFALVEWFAREKSQTFNAAAVAGRLPQGADLSRPEILARAFELDR